MGLVRYDGSFVMVAAHQGNYGQLMFRGCALEEVEDGRTHACPAD